MNAGWVYGAQMPNALNRALVSDGSLVTPYQYLGHEQVLSTVSLKKITKRHQWGRIKCELFSRVSMLLRPSKITYFDATINLYSPLPRTATFNMFAE